MKNKKSSDHIGANEAARMMDYTTRDEIMLAMEIMDSCTKGNSCVRENWAFALGAIFHAGYTAGKRAERKSKRK